MKLPWFSLVVVITISFLWMSPADSAEPKESPAPAADPTRGKAPGEVRDDNGLKIKLVWCPSGKFTMGSPRTEDGHVHHEGQVDVTLTDGFWLGKFEVTQAEWKQVMNSEPWTGQKMVHVGARMPATYVSWDDATDYCRRLTDFERQAGRLSKDWEYTLPTEAQWERACRAGTESRFSFGDDEAKLADYAWFSTDPLHPHQLYPHEVGQQNGNPWGLCDMHGNVWEWCRDSYMEKLPGGTDADLKPIRESKKASLRVTRGGGWFNEPAHVRSASRSRQLSDFRGFGTGFRVALRTIRQVKRGDTSTTSDK